ncbi:formimidoylglutamase [Virgibacillus kekensis]|uniref:Formimidoylglutamase n=1 Tax=Virgibacillus kekensis TaxID=202261 RepID=A0ABV9DH44_9BACI
MNLRHLKPAGQAIFNDRHTTKVKELLTPWREGINHDFGLVGAPLSKPSISHSGAAQAPGAIRAALQSYSTYSAETGIEFTDQIIDFGDLNMHPTDIQGSQHRIYEGLADVYATDAAKYWMVLGGDHSISYSSIKAYAADKTIGVIQFDAHHDLRNTEDGGPTNGTPFRRLLEDGIINGINLVQLGIRDFTNARAYHQYADDNGVSVYTMKDVDDQGIMAILEKEIERLSGRVDEIYMSVDIDVLDQAFAPGCPAIGPGGMDSRTLLQGVRFAAVNPLVNVMDIVEIDPTMDFRNMTSRVAAYVMLEFMKAKRV